MRVIFIFLFITLLADAPLTDKIPHDIWQTYKTKMIPASAVEANRSWQELNPEFSCHLFDDADIENYIQQNWGSEFIQFFQALPIGAMKADLWRYLILTTHGGVYSDLDSVCLIPIHEWILNGQTASSHVLLIDLDAEQSQFCQWTLASTPHHPAMQFLCYYVLKRWKSQGIPLDREGKVDVLGITGPSIFSAALKTYLKEPLDQPAFKIYRKYVHDKDYRKRLNQRGIYLTTKGFFNGMASKNLFWGSWSAEAQRLKVPNP